MRESMKSTASTWVAVRANSPVNRPMPAPSSTTRAPATDPSMPSTYTGRAALASLARTPALPNMQPGDLGRQLPVPVPPPRLQ